MDEILLDKIHTLNDHCGNIVYFTTEFGSWQEESCLFGHLHATEEEDKYGVESQGFEIIFDAHNVEIRKVIVDEEETLEIRVVV